MRWLPENRSGDSFPSDPSGADSKAVDCAIDQSTAQGPSRSRGTGHGMDCPFPTRRGRGDTAGEGNNQQHVLIPSCEQAGKGP